ncbi:gag-pol polyprotein, partial [Trifolium medium]|nr:gag-pol polyprotein [Trifolium medium]
MKVDELIVSLQTYEVAANEKLEKKNKSIAFMSNADVEELDIDVDSTDSISEAIVLLGRQINKVLKRMDRRPRANGKIFTQDTSRSTGTPRKPKPDDKPSQSMGIQCHKCEGYGHIRTKCATY